MAYRYRLKDVKENQRYPSRVIDGTTFYKKRWLQKDSKIEIGKNNRHLIEEESDDPVQVHGKKAPTKQELYQACLEKGFTEEEIKGKTKKYLEGLLSLEEEIDEDT